MPPRVMRRTPASEEAMKYGYRDFLGDAIEKIIADTGEGFRRGADPSTYGREEMLELAMSGVGGGTKIARGWGKGNLPKFADMDETVMFVKQLLETPSKGLEYIPVMKRGMEEFGKRSAEATKKYIATGGKEHFLAGMEEGTRSQWYREAYEVLSGRMPPWKTKGRR